MCRFSDQVGGHTRVNINFAFLDDPDHVLKLIFERVKHGMQNTHFFIDPFPKQDTMCCTIKSTKMYEDEKNVNT